MSAPVTSFSLTIPGEPRGQKRARFGRGFTYTDKDQEAYAATILGEWIAAGRPVLPEGPYSLSLVAWMKRPGNHYRMNGRLTTRGEANPFPTKRPDLDNFIKQIDALVAVTAIPDDSSLVEVEALKRWAEPGLGQPPCLALRFVSIGSRTGWAPAEEWCG